MYTVDSTRPSKEGRTCLTHKCNSPNILSLFCKKSHCRKNYAIVKNNPDDFKTIVTNGFIECEDWEAQRALAKDKLEMLGLAKHAAERAEIAIEHHNNLKRVAEHLEGVSNVLKASARPLICKLLFASFFFRASTYVSF